MTVDTQIAMMDDEITVAYSCTAKKQRQFFDVLDRLASTWKPICPNTGRRIRIRLFPLFCEERGPPTLNRQLQHRAIDAVLHKRTDDMAALLSRSQSRVRAHARAVSALRLLALRATLRVENVVSLDSLPVVWRVVDRCSIAHSVSRAFASLATSPPSARDMAVRGLPWGHVGLHTTVKAARHAIESCVRFPVILKRRLACGTKASHDMVIAHDMRAALTALAEVYGVRLASSDMQHDPEAYAQSDSYASSDDNDDDDGYLAEHMHDADLFKSYLLHDAHDDEHDGLDDDARERLGHDDDFGAGVIVQQFVAGHGGALFKVYAIGDDITIQSRASVDIRDVSDVGDDGYYYFNSQNLDRAEVEFGADCDGHMVVKPDVALVKKIVNRVREEINLDLIGIDLIYDVHRKCYHLIDVNYFPGFKGISNAHESVLQLICKRVCEQQGDSRR